MDLYFHQPAELQDHQHLRDEEDVYHREFRQFAEPALPAGERGWDGRVVVEVRRHQREFAERKEDAEGKQQQAKALKLIRQTLRLESGQLFPFSALTKDGTEAIWEMLDKLLAEAEGSKE